MKQLRTYEELSEIFEYDEVEGVVRWKVNQGKVKKRSKLISLVGGYRSVSYKKKLYREQVLVWLLNYKEYPKKYLTHKDGNKLNNKVDNLCYKGEDIPDKLTQEYLKSQLDYDPTTGVFTRKVSRSGKKGKKGEAAGGLSYGYVNIRVGGKEYKAHRLAVLYMEGYLPEGPVDHRNRKRDDNRYSNLRPDVTHQCQARNREKRSNNSTGVVGVRWSHGSRSKVYATICVKGKTTQLLPVTTDFDEAVCARYAAEQCLGWGTCLDQSTAAEYVKEKIQSTRLKEKI